MHAPFAWDISVVSQRCTCSDLLHCTVHTSNGLSMQCDAHAKCTPNLVGYGLTSHHYPLHVILCEKQAHCHV